MGLFSPDEPPENEYGWEVVENIDVSAPNEPAKNTIYRWVDTEAGVALYYFSGGNNGGLTAVPLSETELEPESQQVAESTSITDEMEQVEEGYRIVWNGRTTPQPVTKVTDSYFEAEGNRGGRYRFFTRGTDAPYLTNLNSGRDYDVDEFEIVQKC